MTFNIWKGAQSCRPNLKYAKSPFLLYLINHKLKAWQCVPSRPGKTSSHTHCAQECRMVQLPQRRFWQHLITDPYAFITLYPKVPLLGNHSKDTWARIQNHMCTGYTSHNYIVGKHEHLSTGDDFNTHPPLKRYNAIKGVTLSTRFHGGIYTGHILVGGKK